ncbi:unnamed protein product [Ambrosiozyma monospora]|uniref:Unnamed protein product n=1 Tax=Ambrosiozyma monospora TaxID=43982 RepID=A0ACB5SY24_AMBMO|nr:unnamed protein product [Ambrosiozyma monospora]
MKFSTFSSAVLASLASQCAMAANVAVYKFQQDNQQQQVPVISSKDSILNLADDLGIAPFYSIEDADELESLSIGKQQQTDNRLLLIIGGVDDPTTFFAQNDEEPIFVVESQDDRSTDLFRSFLATAPQKLMKLKNLKLTQLSEEISILSPKTNTVLSNLWGKNFEYASGLKAENMWSDLKDSFVLQAAHNKPINKRAVSSINDQHFIDELIQLDFFLKEQLSKAEDKVIINLNALTTIFKKTGADSRTYNTCKKMVSDIVSKHLKAQDTFEPTIVVLPIEQQTLTLKFKESDTQSKVKRDGSQKYSLEVVRVFQRARSDPTCFTSEQECNDGTDECSGHGKCIDAAGCYRCSCESQKVNGTTTDWTGASCQKKDVSAPFNLLLWSSVVLIFAFVAGVQLLVKVGDEELPGVLLAATVQTKKST